MSKISFVLESKEVRRITNSVESKLGRVEDENQLSLEDIKEFRKNIVKLLDVVDDEISNWE